MYPLKEVGTCRKNDTGSTVQFYPDGEIFEKTYFKADAIKSRLHELVPGGRIYEQREVIYNALNEIDGLSVVKPTAAFYMFPKLDIKKFGIIDDEKFVLDFLKEKHILFTHGGGFHWDQPDHFRVVFLPEVSVLSTAADRLNDFLSTYHQN